MQLLMDLPGVSTPSRRPPQLLCLYFQPLSQAVALLMLCIDERINSIFALGVRRAGYQVKGTDHWSSVLEIVIAFNFFLSMCLSIPKSTKLPPVASCLNKRWFLFLFCGIHSKEKVMPKGKKQFPYSSFQTSREL